VEEVPQHHQSFILFQSLSLRGEVLKETLLLAKHSDVTKMEPTETKNLAFILGQVLVHSLALITTGVCLIVPDTSKFLCYWSSKNYLKCLRSCLIAIYIDSLSYTVITNCSRRETQCGTMA